MCSSIYIFLKIQMQMYFVVLLLITVDLVCLSYR